MNPLGGGFQQPGVSLGGGGGLGLDLFSGIQTQPPTGFSLPKTVSCSSSSYHVMLHEAHCIMACIMFFRSGCRQQRVRDYRSWGHLCVAMARSMLTWISPTRHSRLWETLPSSSTRTGKEL